MIWDLHCHINGFDGRTSDEKMAEMVRYADRMGVDRLCTYMGYPFSYDLRELAQYYAGYRRLMTHWETTLPGAILPVRYEELVADPVTQVRTVLAFCGLEWENACGQFHLNPSASTTASATQVRRPIYDTSVAQWRHYESELGELRENLLAAGVSPDD